MPRNRTRMLAGRRVAAPQDSVQCVPEFLGLRAFGPHHASWAEEIQCETAPDSRALASCACLHQCQYKALGILHHGHLVAAFIHELEIKSRGEQLLECWNIVGGAAAASPRTNLSVAGACGRSQVSMVSVETMQWTGIRGALAAAISLPRHNGALLVWSRWRPSNRQMPTAQ